MQRCEKCGAIFPRQLRVGDRRLDLRGRKHCLDCRPHRALRGPRKPVLRPAKQLTCELCGTVFAAKQMIDGKLRSLYRRRFCLECSPFGAHNTSKDPVRGPDAETRRLAKRRRRLDSYLRSLNKRRRRRKRELVEARGGGCIDCGYSVSIEALQFHHRDPTTKGFRLGEFNGSLARFLAEAEKCDLVCANCHRLRHAREAAQDVARVVELRRELKMRAVALFGGACRGCGCSYAPAAFDFHHLDAGAKGYGISSDGIYRSWEETLQELRKCVMLCANCHAEVHAGVRQVDGRAVA